ADQIHLGFGTLGPQVGPRRRLELGGEACRLRPEVVHLGPGSLLRLAHLHLLGGDQARDPSGRVIEIAGHDGLFGADDHTGRLQTHLHAVSAVVALGGRLGRRVDVERVVRTGLHARLTADAARAVEVDDPVVAPVERHRGTDGHARGGVAVVAAQHREVPARARKRALLDVLHPGAEGAQRYLVLLLARHRAGVAPDALAVIDHESVAHAWASSWLNWSGNVSSARSKARGAAWPRPQSDASWIVSASSLISVVIASRCPPRSRSIMASNRGAPSRHGVHLPHDSWALKRSSVFTMSTTEAPTGTATIPPVPGETFSRGSIGSSKSEAGTIVPDGPPTTAPRNERPSTSPPP